MRAFMHNEHYETLRARQIGEFAAALPEYAARYRWPAERVRAERERALRALLAAAKRKSPWHARRLAHIDPETFTESELDRLPAMTKSDLMSHYDEIVTDRRINLALVEDHLARLKSDAYLLDSFHVIMSGGSSGKRGVFVYDWEGWMVMGLSSARVIPLMNMTPAREVVAYLTAENAAHGSAAVGQSFAPWFVDSFKAFVPVPISLPLDKMIERLNAVQPTAISGFPSVARQLCVAAADGRLRIRPRAFLLGSEPLYPDVRAALERLFRARIYNFYGCTEASCIGFSCTAGPGMHLSDDLVIVEAVDAAGNPTRPGEPSAKALITNLFNTLMPLIRYELDDSLTFMEQDTPCACGCAFRKIMDIQGRVDESLYYGDLYVHPITFDAPLMHETAVLEYQVRQTPRGARILIVAARPFDGDALAAEISGALKGLGLEAPAVSLELVDRIERTASGKLKYFVPLTQTP